MTQKTVFVVATTVDGVTIPVIVTEDADLARAVKRRFEENETLRRRAMFAGFRQVAYEVFECEMLTGMPAAMPRRGIKLEGL